ncbi:hypothetical protein C6P46_003411 [Rhodotorula mucilaginosa]|uniref:RlpA-like protein double-psi beta-barrel domain-containing protein n=1 Tax=Rhodotorula mucilaginosa TaxID=5537 RepID=A0A9P6W4D9_RHOMI|nr:hypothetical protein C6P46_003411 [Rhodotorula mucilaginosa]
MPSLSFVTAVLALALPFATSVSAASHFSHPRLSRSHARVASRALPRSGRRLHSRGTEATLKCLTEHTFALCDGSNCTDMGPVAAGTKCVDGAITWDTSSEASTQDSNAASAGVESVPVPVVASVSTTTTAPAASSASTSTESDATTTGGAKAGVQLHVDTSNSDDDYVCDDDSSDSSAAGTPWADRGQASATDSADSADSTDSTPVATPTGAAATADFAAVSPAASSSSSAADNVELFVSTTATTSSAPTTTTTTEAPAQTSAAPPSSGGGQVYNGKATYYYQYGVAGSCGVYNSDSTYIVALSYQIVDNGAHCGQKVSIKNTANGKSITATVADTCPSCEASHLDLSEGAFLALGDLSSGVLPIEWSFQ